jgi:hypothetical protein
MEAADCASRFDISVWIVRITISGDRYVPVRIGCRDGELLGEGLDTNAGAALPVGVKREKTVGAAMNRSGKCIHTTAAFWGSATYAHSITTIARYQEQSGSGQYLKSELRVQG